MRVNDFDKIAFAYDRLARVVFGKSIIDSQKYFLEKIPHRSKLLILGGGTGWILTEIFKVKSDIEICYIEASEKMIAIAKEKTKQDERIQFVCGTENEIPKDEQFDFVITNFYLDLFTDKSIKIVLTKIRKSLSPKVQWIVTDFVDTKWWQILMLKMMYVFFSVTCNVKSKKIPAWSEAMGDSGGRKTESRFFYGNFIETALFQF
ncbi:MAG: class I SAM-dependent methyltransferase [Bacteroidetes bacterium]|nr:class I SAM-dependent methyltransferase [Bacteroidota bacterium]